MKKLIRLTVILIVCRYLFSFIKIHFLNKKVVAAAVAAIIQVVGAWYIAKNVNEVIQEKIQKRQELAQERQAKDELAQGIMSEYLTEYIEQLATLHPARKDNQNSSDTIPKILASMIELKYAAAFFAPDEVIFPLYSHLEIMESGEDGLGKQVALILQIRKAFVGKTNTSVGGYMEALFGKNITDSYIKKRKDLRNEKEKEREEIEKREEEIDINLVVFKEDFRQKYANEINDYFDKEEKEKEEIEKKEKEIDTTLAITPSFQDNLTKGGTSLDRVTNVTFDSQLNITAIIVFLTSFFEIYYNKTRIESAFNRSIPAQTSTLDYKEEGSIKDDSTYRQRNLSQGDQSDKEQIEELTKDFLQKPEELPEELQEELQKTKEGLQEEKESLQEEKESLQEEIEGLQEEIEEIEESQRN